MSTLDPNGILLYDETDTRDTFSDLLNMGQESTSDAVGAVRARLTAIEDAGELSPMSGAAFTAASGWDITSQQARVMNGVLFWAIRFTRTGATIPVPSDGNIVNQTIAAVNAGYRPASGMSYPASPTHTGPVVSGRVDVGGVEMSAVSAGVTISTGDEFTLGGTYPVA